MNLRTTLAATSVAAIAGLASAASETTSFTNVDVNNGGVSVNFSLTGGFDLGTFTMHYVDEGDEDEGDDGDDGDDGDEDARRKRGLGRWPLGGGEGGAGEKVLTQGKCCCSPARRHLHLALGSGSRWPPTTTTKQQ